MRRLLALFLIAGSLVPGAPPESASAKSGWLESVEFPWSAVPRHLWVRNLLWLKDAGITHVSLPPAPDPSELLSLIQTIRRLEMEADLEAPVPAFMEALTRIHEGPLTPPLPASAVRVPALSPDALNRVAAQFLNSGKAVMWTDVFDSLSGSVFHPGTVGFDGVERPAALAFRRSAQWTRYWGHLAMTLKPAIGARLRLPSPNVAVRQYETPSGSGFVMVSNTARTQWTGDVRVSYSPAHRFLAIPGASVPALSSLRLPVNIPLMAGPLCRDCAAFATPDHLIYATAELTAMEYENGILAMEYYAPVAGEALLQISREPSGPLVAGGKLAPFVWDDSAKRLKLTIPAGPAPGRRIRIAIAVEPPDATAYFPSAKVLLIGESNRLTAQYSSEAISQRSRLMARAGIEIVRDPQDPKLPLESGFRLSPANTLIDGDSAELAIEADGIRLSHAQPRLRKPATLTFPEGIAVRLGPASSLALYPATIPVNQKAGREVTVVIHNNAPEIRNFQLELAAEGVEFSPSMVNVTVGVSAARPVTFRVFSSTAKPGVHTGTARLLGQPGVQAAATEDIRFVVLPQTAPVAWSADGFHFLESLHQRATFLPGRWLEFIGKDNGRDALPAGGIAFSGGSMRTEGEGLVTGAMPGKAFHLTELETLVPKPAPRKPE